MGMGEPLHVQGQAKGTNPPPPLAHLHQPGPDCLGRSGDLNRPRRVEVRIRHQGVAGHARCHFFVSRPPAAMPCTHGKHVGGEPGGAGPYQASASPRERESSGYGSTSSAPYQQMKRRHARPVPGHFQLQELGLWIWGQKTLSVTTSADFDSSDRHVH